MVKLPREEFVTEHQGFRKTLKATLGRVQSPVSHILFIVKRKRKGRIPAYHGTVCIGKTNEKQCVFIHEKECYIIWVILNNIVWQAEDFIKELQGVHLSGGVNPLCTVC